jgi:hypothetical protein
MQYLKLDNLGGLKVTQNRFAWMQQGMLDSFVSLAKLCGNKVILYGVVVAAGNVSPGFISYNGELVEFVGGPVAAQVKIVEIVNSYAYANNTVQPVEIKRRAELVAAGGDFLFADLNKLPELYTINANLVALTAAFTGHTHTHAEVFPNAAAYISYRGSKAIGDLGADNLLTVTIPNQGTSDYTVVGNVVGSSTNHLLDNDVSIVVRAARTATTFQISLREYSTNTQNVSFQFAIIKSV